MLKTRCAWPLAALLLSACAAIPGSDQGVRQGMERFATAFNQQDAAGVASVFEADAKLLPEGSPMITGRDGILKFWKGGFDAGLSHISKTPIEIHVSGDLATETSHYVVTFKDQQIAGKDILVWRRGADGDWRIASDIWNSDKK